MLQCKHLQVDRWYCTGYLSGRQQVVVSISQENRDCWSLLLIGALTTRSGERRVLGSFFKIQEGKASVFGHQLL